MNELKRIHCIVSGLVQGVFYRSFAERNARELKLTGYAKNLSNGEVEVVAEGNEAELVKLIKKLQEGPASSRIEKVKVNWKEFENEFKDFSIEY
ncbi:MAG TPA: acylphosphatase [archaeon]|nr:acylphosphatase [archaeon]